MLEFLAPRVDEVVSGILVLSGAGEPRIPIATIHSILHEMKPHEPVLSAVRFSITGDVCFSRKVDVAIKLLVARGTLRMIDPSAVAVARVPMLRTRLLASLTYSQFHALQSASSRFYERLADAAREPSGMAACE